MNYEKINAFNTTPIKYENVPCNQQKESEKVQQRLHELENTLKQYISQKEVIR